MHERSSPSRRRVLLRGAAAGAALGVVPVAMAQSGYPEKTVRFVVNFPPGGPLDILARTLAEKLQDSLGQPFVVENKPGAGGNIGSDLVAKAAADGYSVLLSIDTPFTINPGVYKSLPFKPDDLKPVMTLASSGLMIAVHPSVGAETLEQLVAKGKQDALTFGNAGNGSPGHLAASIFSSTTGARVNHILYKGNAPAVLAVVSGEVQAGILATPGFLPQVKAGKVLPVAVTSPKRSPLAPDVPTVAEAGVPDLGFEVLYDALVPAATPQAVVDRLASAFTSALAEPEVRKRLASLDMEVLAEPSDAARQRLDRLRERYARTIAATGMRAE